jgi:calcineurin-like phosphoesterase family protein
MPVSDDPARVVFVGDVHGNTEHTVAVISRCAAMWGPSWGPLTFVQVGDFGIWQDDAGFLSELNSALIHTNATLYFIDGNHENYDLLKAYDEISPRPGPAIVMSRIFWMRRGERVTWSGREILFLGGAVSVDKIHRREGESWWPEEELTEADRDRAVAGGTADIMVTHDSPSIVPVTLGPWPRMWDRADEARSNLHRVFLQTIVNRIKPAKIIHGHYHQLFVKRVKMEFGTVEVTCLNLDGERSGNYAVLDLVTGEWEPLDRLPA